MFQTRESSRRIGNLPVPVSTEALEQCGQNYTGDALKYLPNSILFSSPLLAIKIFVEDSFAICTPQPSATIVCPFVPVPWACVSQSPHGRILEVCLAIKDITVYLSSSDNHHSENIMIFHF